VHQPHQRLHLLLPTRLHRHQMRDRHQPLPVQHLSQRRSLLYHRQPARLPVLLPARLRRHDLRAAHQPVQLQPMPERRHLPAANQQRRLHLLLPARLLGAPLRIATHLLQAWGLQKRRHLHRTTTNFLSMFLSTWLHRLRLQHHDRYGYFKKSEIKTIL